MYGSITTPAAATEAPIIKGATIWSGVVNLSNTIVGAGMIGLPGAFGGTGWLSGVVLLVVAAAFSAHGLVLLSKAACISGQPSSFYSVAMASVPQYTILIDAAVAMKCFGVATGYLITISDSMVNALDHIILTGDPEQDERFIVSLLLSRHIWVLGALVLVLPFSFYRTLDELKKASALALVFVLLLVGMVVSYANGVADPCAGMQEDTCRGEMDTYTTFGETLAKLPVFVFAFTCHQNIFPIVNELDALCQRRLNIVICCSIGFALTVFAVVALEGYRTYGSLVRGDILLNYPENQQVTFLRICIAFMLALHYPLQLDPSRRCITSLVKVIAKWHRTRRRPRQSNGAISASSRERLGEIEMEQEEESAAKSGTKKTVEEGSSYYEMSHDDETQQTEENWLFNAITVSFLSFSFLLAMAVDDLGVILALVGATGSTLVSYVLPGLIYIKIYSRDDTSKKMAWLQLGAGITIMPLALYFILTQQIGFSHAFHVATPMHPARTQLFASADGGSSSGGMMTLNFVGETTHISNSAPAPDGDKKSLVDFFELPASAPLILRGSKNNDVYQLEDVDSALLEQYEQMCNKVDAERPLRNDRFFEVTTSGVKFPGLQIVSCATIGVQVLTTSEELPAYQLVLVRDSTYATGNRLFVWFFNAVTGKDKGDDERGSTPVKDQTTVSLNKISVVQRDDGRISFVSNAMLGIEIRFPALLMRAIPGATQPKFETSGGESLMKALDGDIPAALELFRKEYIQWLES